MRKAAKFIILGAGLIGLLAFFLPLIAVEKSGVEGKLSAYTIVKGIDKAQDIVGSAATGSADEEQAVDEANDALSDVKAVVLAIFVPALLLAIMGGIAVARRRIGRGFGIMSLLVGLLGLAIWAILNSAATAPSGESAAGIGMHMLMLTGLGGIVGGIIAKIKPEPKLS